MLTELVLFGIGNDMMLYTSVNIHFVRHWNIGALDFLVNFVNDTDSKVSASLDECLFVASN